MPDSTQLIGTVSYGAGAFAFLALAVPLMLSWRGRLQGGLLTAASAATVVWCAAVAYGYWLGATPGQTTPVLELLRSVLWIAFLWSALAPRDYSRARPWRGAYLLPISGLAFVLLVAADIGLLRMFAVTAPHAPVFLRLLIAVAGLVLTESLYRNTPPDERWHNKFLCLAVGGLFTYDMFLYADAALFLGLNETFLQARGVVQAVVAPLLLVAVVRNRMWRSNVHVSRQVALHSTTLIAGGVYIFFIALVGFYLRELGGGWGGVLQVTYFFGAVVLLAVVLFSGTVRSYAKVFISKHFYSFKYDYRAEWHKFMGTLSADQEVAPLEERVVKAVADIVDSPGGAMWLLEEDRYVAAAGWNLTPPPFSETRDGSLARFVGETQWVVDIGKARSGASDYADLRLPEALRDLRRAWLLVPLWHHGLIGFIVLAQPRSPRSLGWEDYDLLKTVGRQAASYLAERKAMRALDQAREFEIFNRRFAFVVHDIKNLVSQLSLIASNYQKFGDNKDFRDDMAETVSDAAATMKRLIAKINAQQGGAPEAAGIELRSLLRDIVRANNGGEAELALECQVPNVAVAGDRERIGTVIGQLVQNAVEAVGKGGRVRVALSRLEQSAVIDVIDNGPGMDERFIREKLFKPFRSTKSGGMGIGVYQCREYVKELGGRLDVISEPGKGTTMRVTLPVLAAPVTDRAADRSREAL